MTHDDDMPIDREMRMRRLQAVELHEAAHVEAGEIEIEDIGMGVSLKSEGYRLSIVNNFLYLTDRNTRECTCHGKGRESIRELFALLQRADEIMRKGGS